MSDNKITDVGIEMLCVGTMYKCPDMYLDYGKSINKKYDFSDNDALFFYDLFEKHYLEHGGEVNEKSMVLYLNNKPDIGGLYKSKGGWKTIEKICEIANVDSIKNYYQTLKKFSLLREFSKKGFDVEFIMKHKDFSRFSASDVTQIIHYRMNKIYTEIGGGNDAVNLSHNILDQLKEWMENPKVGYSYGIELLDEITLGLHKKKVAFVVANSNVGKSRFLINLLNKISLNNGKKVLLLTNEMTLQDYQAAILTTVANENYKMNMPQKEIVLGSYKLDQEKTKNIFRVAEYIEEKSRVFILEMSKYSDEELEKEIKRYKTIYDIEIVVYDVLKNYSPHGEDWSKLKATSNHLANIAKELDIAMLATIQATDDAQNIDVFEADSTVIASAKQINHISECTMFLQRIKTKDYNKYSITSHEGWGDSSLDRDKVYIAANLIKNRNGQNRLIITWEVDLDLNTWKMLGFLKKNGKG